MKISQTALQFFEILDLLIILSRTKNSVIAR